MSNLNIYFVGLSKNCFQTLKYNLDFINLLIKHGLKEVKIIIVDSDSIDGTKELCRSLEYENLIFIEEDNLNQKFQNRIEILAYCRNKGLQTIDKTKDSLYIPMDLDIDLFSFIEPQNFVNLINNFLNDENLDALFPFSDPYYYDIFALRKMGWVNKNEVLVAHKLKQKFKIGSFFFNYFYVFNKQVTKNYFSEDMINVQSAFGGIGFYKIFKNKDYLYETESTDTEFYSEHLSFNKNFNNLFIDKNWTVPAPSEHIHFHLLSRLGKIIYILKTFKYDILSFLNKRT